MPKRFDDDLEEFDLAYALFTSNSCDGCIRIEKTLYELGKKGAGVFLINTKVLDNKSICAKYAVTKTPTVVVFSKGKIKAHLVGVYPESKYYSYMYSDDSVIAV